MEVGDIGAIRVPPNLLGSTDFPFIPVMVTKLHVSKKTGGIKYGLCTQHGYLHGYYYRQMISHEPKMNAAIVNINTSKADFK